MYLPASLQETTPTELKSRFQSGVATLERSLDKGFLYEMPWFLLIGGPGSGKTRHGRPSVTRRRRGAGERKCRGR